MNTEYTLLFCKPLRIFTMLFLALLGTFQSQAQNLCPGSEQVCAQAPLAIDSLAGNDAMINVPCFGNDPLPFLQVFQFQSGVDATNGQASLSVDNINFFGSEETEISAAVFTPFSGPFFCNFQSAQLFDNQCETNDTISFELDGISADQTYFLFIAAQTDSVSFNINLAGDPFEIDAGADVLTDLGFEVELDGASNGDPTNEPPYQWTPFEVFGEDQFQEQVPIALPEEEGETVVTVAGEVAGCEVTDDLVITVNSPIQLYNFITPNADGVNDVWNIPGIVNFERAVVSIYTRWGQQVFKSIGYPEPWDGTNRGKKLATGTYYYVIELRSLEVEIPPYTGFVAIIN